MKYTLKELNSIIKFYAGIVKEYEKEKTDLEIVNSKSEYSKYENSYWVDADGWLIKTKTLTDNKNDIDCVSYEDNSLIDGYYDIVMTTSSVKWLITNSVKWLITNYQQINKEEFDKKVDKFLNKIKEL